MVQNPKQIVSFKALWGQKGKGYLGKVFGSSLSWENEVYLVNLYNSENWGSVVVLHKKDMGIAVWYVLCKNSIFFIISSCVGLGERHNLEPQETIKWGWDYLLH